MPPRPRSLEHTIDLMRGDIAGDEFRKWHALVARTALAEHLAEVGDRPRVERFVDGRKDAVEESVSYGGTIRYEFVRAAIGVEEVLRWLIAEGNKVSTKYGDAFAVGVLATGPVKFAGGPAITLPTGEARMIPARQFRANSPGIPADAGFIIVNTQSWSRKVDVQMIGRQPMIFSIPQFIMERAAMWLRARHPELVVKRWYTSEFSGQYRLKTPGRRAGERVHSPALLIARAS